MNARREREHWKAPARVKPNFFVALQVSDPNIHEAIRDVQKSLWDANLNSEPELVDVAKLHITLLVVHIENDEQLLDASSALDKCGNILSQKFTGTPIRLSFQGLSNFSNKIIFAKPLEDDHFKTLLDIGKIVKDEFSKMNVAITDYRDLNPHLTIARLLERPNYRDKSLLHEVNQKFLNKDFGSQVLSGLQLLRMCDDKDENGYYIMVKQVPFDGSDVPVKNLSKVLSIPEVHHVDMTEIFLPHFCQAKK